MWQYGTPGGETVFDFQLGRGRDGPRKFLKDWNGILQTDGYQAYDQVGGPGLIHVGCWRTRGGKFVDAVKVNPKDGAAIAMVTRMDALFLVDRETREQQLKVEERSDLRREHAHPWVDEIHSECGKLRAQLLPKSALGEAVNYTLNMWAKLKRCFEHAEVELSNNIAENSMRPVALGRKNWLHVGSPESGPKVAAILSVVESLPQAGHSRQRLLAGRAPLHESKGIIGSLLAYSSPMEIRPRLNLDWSDGYGAPILTVDNNGWVYEGTPVFGKPIMKISGERVYRGSTSWGAPIATVKARVRVQWDGVLVGTHRLVGRRVRLQGKHEDGWPDCQSHRRRQDERCGSGRLLAALLKVHEPTFGGDSRGIDAS